MIAGHDLSKAIQEYGVMGRSCDGGAECRWIPLLELHADGHRLGLSSSGHWVGDSASGLIDFAAHHWYAPLLPLLERRLPEFTEELERALSVKGLSPEVARTFPFNELIGTALGQSSYWVARALAWLEGLPIAEEFIPLLKSASEDKSRVQQTVRQHAGRLLRRTDKGPQGGLVGAAPHSREP
jgi:hypothetical protein